jgi:hypothetical protein
LEPPASFGVSINRLKYNLPIGYVIKLMPLRWFDNITVKEEPLTDEQEADGLVAKLRKSHRQSVR